ncbi:LysR family transcriptional regulator [Arenibaculum pallidiluteum]|uniref:LysR family transcriptional regulator n=1 Tax=Arenibaculum pallidiluteum TaxID=2812559 RepID=UPI001A95C5C0|nr:LysR family transcriptional regulator [Arenibaculum pallidiluteum]
MASLEDYAAFVAVVEQGSLTGAARQLGRSLQAVSRALASLERELGVALVARTTRRLRPTEAGLAFHRRIKAALSDIALARDELAARGGPLTGRVRIGASTQFGPLYLMPILTAFMERHPGIEIELALADEAVGLVENGLDLALRIGSLADSSLQARRLGAVRRVAFGAPGYFAARGRPQHPRDLAAHDCILRRTAGRTETWVFGEAPAAEPVEVRGRFRSDSAPARNEAAAAGLGIAIAPLYQIRGLLDAGRIELVLAGHELARTPVHLLWPAGAGVPNRTRALIDFIAARLSLAGL